MKVTLLGIEIEDKLMQYPKELSPMEFTLSGMVIETKLLH